MIRRLPVIVLLVTLVASSPGVHASWSPDATGPGRAVALTVGAGHAPSPTVEGRTVRLDWVASTLSNGTPVDGYVVRRYDASDGSGQSISSGTCASVVSATSCAENSVPPGSWSYAVTPVFAGWRGAEGPAVLVTVAAPSLDLSPSVTATPATLTGTIANFTAGDTITFHLDQDSGTELAGTVDGVATPASVPPGGGAPVSVSLPSGLTEGAHTIHAVASPSGDGAAATVTVDDAAPGTPTITSGPVDPTTDASATFAFTGSDPDADFRCSLDGGAYSLCSSPHGYSGLVDGSHSFSVKAVDPAGNESLPATHVWRIDTTVPVAAISFPGASGYYNDGGYSSGCGTGSGDMCGTASDGDGTGVAAVQVSIRGGSGSYWDGTGFSSATEVLFAATGTTTWSYGFAAGNFPANGDYTVRVVATDALGNARSSSATFTIDRTPPFGADIQTVNASGGTAGRAEAGDTVTFTYSEPIKPGTILAGWDGSATNVVVRVNHGAIILLVPTNDTLQVWNAANNARLPLGTVDLGASDYVSANVTFGAAGVPATMVQNGSSVTVTLGTPSNAGSVTTALLAGTMSWTPASDARDRAENMTATTAASESGGLDKEF